MTALEVAIVTKERGHIAKKDYEKIKQAVDDEWLKLLEEGTEPFEVEQWSYTNQLATFSVPNDTSAGQVEAVVREHGFLAVPKAAIMNERRPSKILTGLVTGPAASRDRTTLERLLRFEAARLKISGRMEYHSAHLVQKSGNLLLKIVVDDVAMQGMEENSFELRIGASGKVKFLDDRAEKKINKQEDRKLQIEALEKQIEEQKNLLKETLRQRKELEQVDTDSVGSAGLSQLSVDVDEMETEAEKEKAETDKTQATDQKSQAGLSLFST